MGKIITLFCLLIFLAGCASSPPAEVRIPVPVQAPQPPEVSRPHLPIADLKKGDPPPLVERAYAASVKALQGYAGQLEQIIDGYRSPQKNKEEK